MEPDKTEPCPHCGTNLPSGLILCPECGGNVLGSSAAGEPEEEYVDYPRFDGPSPKEQEPGLIYKDPEKHKVWVAMVGSFVCIAGLGQAYNGQYRKALIVFASALTVALTVPGYASLAVLAVAAVDAGMVAKKLASGEGVGQWETFPTKVE